jgi:glycosyltransferase involved in cell wall biosynthesis
MLGQHNGYSPIMGEILAGLFAQNGYSVVITSRCLNRGFRLLDIARTIVSKRQSIDIQVLQVYSGLSFIAEDLASWLGQRLGQKIIMHIHGGAMPEFMAHYPNWTRRVLRRADAIVVPSPFLARALALYGFQSHIVPNVLTLSEYPYRRRRNLTPRLFWMRAFHPIYNPEMAIRVLACVRQVFPDATLVMAGQDKGMQKEIEELANKCGVASAVRFPGFLDAKSKIREGEAADIFLNTNHIDNTPVSVLEACAMGLPVVATKVGGIGDLLTDGETGMLVADDDDEAMAQAVVNLLLNPDLAERLSVNGRRLAEKSAWERVRPQWESLFAQVMA